MHNAVRSVRTQPVPTLFSSPQFPYQIRRNTCSGFGFKQTTAAAAAATEANNNKSPEPAVDERSMDKQQQTNHRSAKTVDVMSHSFGEGYATRSDEEGFGGIYGGNDLLYKEEEVEIIHENHSEFDRTQGSEVAEKEKARHQKTAES